MKQRLQALGSTSAIRFLHMLSFFTGQAELKRDKVLYLPLRDGLCQSLGSQRNTNGL